VPPPTHLSASALVAATRDPHRWAEQQRRPMPSAPRPAARQGTAFHAWVEQLYGNPQLLDLDELPGAADAASDVVDDDLAVLQAAFRQSGWAERTPREVEAPFEMVVDGVVLRGRADAVFDDGDGLLVVDWKTGPPPRDEAELAARSVQLAVYRLAFAALHGRPVAQVRAAFHHVREQRSLTGDGLADEATLRALVRAAVATG
jgi:DNA helicase-2/ATP-dependent DNA helicase PcrA